MRHQPALQSAEESLASGSPLAARSEAWCLMLDGTWQLITVAGWQQDGVRWRCLLQWGVYGTVYEGWYFHESGKLVRSN